MSSNQKVCFVVQGFGPKTDYTDGRVLNLDASYEVIKQAVEEAGLRCVRADEIIHSGTIDIPMYEQLLRADLVIADLSTYNVNAAFELGVRYGLRPYSTIVLAEEKFKSPFDINHIVIRRYKHLGEDIGRREAERLKGDLKKTIGAILADAHTDSPVYAMLPGLSPPLEAALAKVSEKLAEESPTDASSAVGNASVSIGAARGVGAPAAAAVSASRSVTPTAPEPPSAREWLARAQQAMKQDDFVAATGFWSELLKLSPSDNHAVQQLALATYKSKQPDAEQALKKARSILLALSPATTNDPETLGLWGAIHKRLWEIHRSEAELSEAISACERGFALKQDHYNGINFAFMLNIRAVESARRGEIDEAVADSVQATRVRRDLIRYASPLVEREDLDEESRYWLIATLWEASLGIGDVAGAARWESQARQRDVPAWMQKTREEQAERLLQLQKELAAIRASHAQLPP